jgi:hypothetical protein
VRAWYFEASALTRLSPLGTLPRGAGEGLGDKPSDAFSQTASRAFGRIEVGASLPIESYASFLPP